MPAQRPLYARVYKELAERIRSGRWKAGQLIPNEFEIAEEFGVSQGTARKALVALADAKLIVRHQGRGSYVYEHTPDDILFRFFNLFDRSGERILPVSRSMSCVAGKANAAERKALGLAKEGRVIRISRTRAHGRRPFITETVSLPEATFPGLAELPEIPDTFYDVFQKTYGVLVTDTEERVTATVADAACAADLGVPVGTPLVRIERTAFTLDARPVEWRVSLCHLRSAYYRARTR